MAKGLMEGKGEQGEHKWSLGGRGGKARNITGTGQIKYVICDDLTADI